MAYREVEQAEEMSASGLHEAPEALEFDIGMPLVLDLDGTLILTDALHESFVVFLKRRPQDAWRVPLWLARGRAVLKERLAEVVTEEDAEGFPVNTQLVALARREAARGRRIVMATAANVLIARQIQTRFPFITEIVASEGGVNLKGSAKAQKVRQTYPGGFIYAGDSASDLHVWDEAHAGLFVGRSAAMARKIRRRTALAATLPTPLLDVLTLRRGMRLHQWAKNALVFVPMILAGKALDVSTWLRVLCGFAALGLLASATYLFNDLWDLAEDRRHWSKRFRPLASGRLQISTAIAIISGAGGLAFAIGLGLGAKCALALLLYLALSLTYTLRLKREPIVDIAMLASMFTMRLAIGLVISEVVFSPWLFVFSMFIFLSLSAAKRHTEIVRMVAHGKASAPGRGYLASDAPLVLALGVSAMVATTLIMVIYLVQEAFPAAVYRNPASLWGLPMVVFLWLSRIWLLCHRGVLNDDPVAFALRDKLSLGYGAAALSLFVLALA